MSKTQEFVKSEKDRYGKIFADIAFGVDNISGLIDKQDLNNRKFTTRIGVLKKYLQLLDSAEAESKHKSFLSNLFSGDKYVDLLTDYKREHREDLTQLENCAKCECLNCTAQCKFDSCNGCTQGRRVVYCNHQSTNVSIDNSGKPLELTNNNTGESDLYKILAYIQDAKKDKRYIIIENTSNAERFILYYYPGISEDTYGEITDEEDFNFAASAYENLERS
ncbi:MAG: DUF1292 domain-containing protein [Bacillota bacterium]|nr:DUF1292 domain-containing protein [Bacillota bacterium]